MRRCGLLSIVLLTAISAAAQPAPSWRLVIPAVAATDGAHGSQWHTDMVISNPSAQPASIHVALMPAAANGQPVTVASVDLPNAIGPGQNLAIADFVSTYFPGQIAGAAVVTARDPAGAGLPIIVTTRIWTSDGDAQGTFGQGIPAVAWDTDGDLGETDRALIGLDSDTAFRTNLGLLNLSEFASETFQIDVSDADGTVLTSRWLGVAPLSWTQLNDLLAGLDVEGSNLRINVGLVAWHSTLPDFADPADAPDWITYASVVDNRTNDPTFVEAIEKTTRWGITRQRIVPAVAHSPGEGGSTWVSDLVAYHSGTETPTFLQVDVLPTDGVPLGSPSSLTIPIWPGQSIAVGDILGSRFPSHELAGLVVKGWNGGALYTDLLVGTRTWTTAADGEGTYGQAIPGVPRHYGDDPVVVAGLRRSDAFRSNLGLVNPSTNLREDLAVEILDSGGVSRGTVTRTLEPKSQTQINRILDSLDLDSGVYTAIVTLAGSENLYIRPTDPWDPIYTAYGSVVDNTTNDPTYLPGSVLLPPQEDTGDWYDFSSDEPWYRCPEDDPPAEATVVRTFNQAYHYFGAENHRSIVEEVDFPESGQWNEIGLRIHLECPESGDCDDWDRTGSLQMVLNPEAPQEEWQYLELARYITPYKIEMCEYIDLTALGPLLTGHRTLESWIDTWVGPGNASGEGWRITYDFVFYPGTPRTPSEVRNVWGRRTVNVGVPGDPVDAQVDPLTVDIPADVTRVEARLLATGHSFGNTDNCAEFCVLRQDVFVGDQRRSVVPWRTDCEYNPHSPQAGTWTYDRNGWCPGAVVVGDTIDLTDLVTPGESTTIDFDIRNQDGSVYEDTTDNGNTPFEWVSMQLFFYRDQP